MAKITMKQKRESKLYLKSVILKGNGKLKDFDNPETGEKFRYMQFSTQAIKDCPFASDGCKAICYATKGNHQFPSVKLSRERAKADSLKDDFAECVIYTVETESESGKYKGTHILFRLHESGDFYSLAYLKKWIKVFAHFLQDSDVLITFVFYSKSFPLFLLLSEDEKRIFNACLEKGIVSMQVSLDDTTTAEQLISAAKLVKEFPLVNSYRCSESVEGVADDDICDCADCAKCSKCNHADGRNTVVKIHSASEDDMKTYRKKSRKSKVA